MQKHLAIDRGVRILVQKSRGGGGVSTNRPHASLRVNRKSSFSGRVGFFCIFKCVFLKTTFTTNYCHIEGSNFRNFASMALNFTGL